MIKYFCLLILLLLLSCTNPAPKTTYYVLHADDAPTTIQHQSQYPFFIGIGPIDIPGYLKRNAIASFNAENQVDYSSTHAWSSKLDAMLTETFRDELSIHAGMHEVVAFPWQMNTRPQYQLKIQLVSFAGRLGESVSIKFYWQCLELADNHLVQKGVIKKTITLEEDGYDAYVKALNQLIIEASSDLATVALVNLD